MKMMMMGGAGGGRGESLRKCVCCSFVAVPNCGACRMMQHMVSFVCVADAAATATAAAAEFSVTRKKSPNVYKSCPKLISQEKC